MAKKRRSKSRFSDQFKRTAIERVASGSISQKALAEELGISVTALHGWRHGPLAQAGQAPAPASAAPEPSPTITRTQYSADFKRQAIGRLLAGKISLGDLSAETKVSRKLLARWRRELAPSLGLTPAPVAPPAAADSGDLSTEALYALVGRLTVDNQMLRRRLGDG